MKSPLQTLAFTCLPSLVAAGAGCFGSDGPDQPPGYTVVLETSAIPTVDLDLLFVIDNSPSMADKQARLAADLPALINELTLASHALPNLHVGMVTTDMGTKATGSATPGPAIGTPGQAGCSLSGDNGVMQTFGAPVTGAFLRDVASDGARTRNYTGTLADVLGTMVTGVGTSGCGFEQPLHAMKRALEGNVANTGFLRDSATLGVVFLTDEDDCTASSTTLFGPTSPALGSLSSFRCTRFGVTCSGGGATPDEMNVAGSKTGCRASTNADYLEPVEPFRDFLVDLKGGVASRIAVASISGAPTPVIVEMQTPPQGGAQEPALAPSCGSGLPLTAAPAVRIQTFLDLFPTSSSAASICDPTYDTSLRAIARRLNQSLGSTCLERGLPDLSPGEPGTQSSCIVEDIVGSVATRIEPCGTTGATTCWRIETDAASCMAGDHQKLVVDRASVPDPSTVTRLRCLTP